MEAYAIVGGLLLTSWVTFHDVEHACSTHFLRIRLLDLLLGPYALVRQSIGVTRLLWISGADFVMNGLMLVVVPSLLFLGRRWPVNERTLIPFFSLGFLFLSLVKGEFIYQAKTRSMKQKRLARELAATSAQSVAEDRRFESALQRLHLQKEKWLLFVARTAVLPAIYRMFYERTFSPFFIRQSEIGKQAVRATLVKRCYGKDILRAFNTVGVYQSLGPVAFHRTEQNDLYRVLEAMLQLQDWDPRAVEKYIAVCSRTQHVEKRRSDPLRFIVGRAAVFERKRTAVEFDVLVVNENHAGMLIETDVELQTTEEVSFVCAEGRFPGIVARPESCARAGRSRYGVKYMRPLPDAALRFRFAP